MTEGIRGRLAAALSIPLLVLAGAASAGPDELPPIDPKGVTISGISSGASMAHQVHVAYPELVHGIGVVAGIPWNCAEGRLDLALGRCIGKEEGPLPVADVPGAINAAHAAGTAGDPALLADDPVWLFHGAKDALVPAKVAHALATVYQDLVPDTLVERVEDVPAGHLFPTLDAGGACDAAATPWLGACGYDAAGELLGHLYGELDAPTDADRSPEGAGQLLEVELPGAAAAGLDPKAWLFVPESCPENGCRLHLALHGCAQAASQVGTAFVEQAGYLPWARANGIVVAFPQAVAQPVNPLACWDWWGYTGANYLARDGAQPKVLADWVRSLTRE